jgi:hypothetical protein
MQNNVDLYQGAEAFLVMITNMAVNSIYQLAPLLLVSKPDIS